MPAPYRPDEADARLRLRECDELLALAPESGGLGLFEWQVRSGRVRLSRKLLELYGLAELDGRYGSWLRCIFREDQPRLTDAIDTAFAAQARDFRIEFRIIRPSDGKLAWI